MPLLASDSEIVYSMNMSEDTSMSAENDPFRNANWDAYVHPSTEQNEPESVHVAREQTPQPQPTEPQSRLPKETSWIENQQVILPVEEVYAQLDQSHVPARDVLNLRERAENELREPPEGINFSNAEKDYWRTLEGASFNRLQRVREELKDQVRAHPQDATYQRNLDVVNTKISQLENFAEENGLFDSINTRRDGFEAEVLQLSRGELSPEAQQDLLRRLREWRGVDSDNDATFIGMAEYKVKQYRDAMAAAVGQRVAESERSPSRIMEQVMDRTQNPTIRLSNIEHLYPEDQRHALGLILDELEKPEMTPDDSNFKNYRNALETVMPLLDSENRRMVDARLRLQVCWSALQKVNTADAEGIKRAFSDAVIKIGAYGLNGDSLNVFLAEREFGGEIPGLYTADAMGLLQAAALRGEYSHQRTDSESINEDVAQQLLALHAQRGMTIADARKSVQLADRLAEATFEKSLWDTTGGKAKIQAYMSEAMYFSTWRIRDKKGFALSAGHIPTIATSFLRRSKYADNHGGQRVFFGDEYAAVNADTPNRQKVELLIENQTLAGDHPRALDFHGVDFSKLETNVYKSYLESYIPKVFEIKDLLTKTDFNLQSLQNDQDLIKMYDKFKQFDPNNSMQLFFFYYSHALRGAAFNGGHASQLHDELREVITQGLKAGRDDGTGLVEVSYKLVPGSREYKVGRIYPFKQKTNDGQPMWDFIADYSGFEAPAREAAFDDFAEQVNLLRVVGLGNTRGK